MEYLEIRGAREHNLKNINVKLPRNKFIVITGLSGSGKSSLAFDTIYAEGQRRYVESLSSYARMFLGQMEKPDMDYISGLSPAISIDQKTTSRNPRSTVGTVTEIHDYFRLLFARAGLPHCPECGKPIERQSVDQMIAKISEYPQDSRITILSPVVRAKKGRHEKILEDLQKNGFIRARIDGEIHELDEEITLEKNIRHTIEAVIDRIRIRTDMNRRLSDSIETALKLSGGLVIVLNNDTNEEETFNENYSCPDCGVSIDELSPRMFSFNSPFGACPECGGLGAIYKIDVDAILDREKSLSEGAIHASGWNLSMYDKWMSQQIKAAAKHFGFSTEVPFKDLPEKAQNIVLYGSGDENIVFEYKTDNHSFTNNRPFEGVVPNLERRYAETSSEGTKREIEGYMYESPCHVCEGKRYNKQALAVTIGGKNISELSDMSVVDLKKFMTELKLGKREEAIAERLLKEINARLDFLINVGLGYLTLSRSAGTLSGGEAQRIRLATQIGSGLTGVLYILDEPSIGLHQRDNEKLLNTLQKLRDLGNTLIVVEHDIDTMLAADYILDIGPGAGVHGGNVVACGTPQEVMANPDSLTGKYLSGEVEIAVPKQRRERSNGYLKVIGARENNLKGIDAEIPVGVVTCITGVSGSGKSSLVNQIIYKATARELNGAHLRPGKYERIEGMELLDKVVNIDQSPIGRTPRSNPATYTGMFDMIRELFAQTQDAKVRGYNKGRFSFNVKGGRCEACKGDGIIKIEMNFLPDVYVPCEVCGGMRYTRETLEVRYKGKNIYEVLEMTVEDALQYFSGQKRILDIVQTLYDVGLGYIKLGQPSTTLSGGEAQRIKLATYLSKKQTGKTLFILDEPTTGLHSADIQRLVDIIDRLANKGNTVLIIEHNLDVIKRADYIIDLGPEGGDAGGKIICKGTPEEVAKVKKSYTGQFLKKVLK